MKVVPALSKSRWIRFVGALVGVVIPALWLWTLVSPGEEMTRIRSSLLSEVGDKTNFDWKPEQVPNTFLTNKGSIAPVFAETAKNILDKTATQRSEFAIGLSIAKFLMEEPTRNDGPIRSNLITTLHQIKNAGAGYCADFSKVFNAIAIAAGIPVRQWGFAFDAFGSGHTFNEVFDRERGKWILIDSFHSLYFVDPVTQEPLSVLEAHDRLLNLESSRNEIAIHKIVPERFSFRSDALALDYYRRGMPQLYLVMGNNVFDYENNLSYKLTSKVSRSLEELTSIIAGHYPRMLIYPIAVSDRDVSELELHRTRLLLAAISLFFAAIFLLIEVAGLFATRISKN